MCNLVLIRLASCGRGPGVWRVNKCKYRIGRCGEQPTMTLLAAQIEMAAPCEKRSVPMFEVEKGNLMVILSVRFKLSASKLTKEELVKVAEERKPDFQAFPGLKQKYYIANEESGEYGGVYIWESRDALQAFQESNLKASMMAAYQLTEPPQVEVLDVGTTLRP